MAEIDEVVTEAVSHAAESKLNATIAILVAITAIFVSVFNIKDGNIVQAMSQAQAHSIDAWSFYQAKSMKMHLAEDNKDQLTIQLAILENASLKVKNLLHEKIASFENQIAKYEKEKAEIKKQAEGFQAEYDRLNIHDDQFDMAEAFLSIAIAVYGITALTQQRRLLYFGIGLSLLGVILGISGFAGFGFHPDWLASLLS